MMGLCRWILQVVLVIAVGFFGWHYFTRPELHQCVSIPLSTLDGKTDVDLDQEKVDLFMTRLNDQLHGVASRSGELIDTLSSIETPEEAVNPRDELLDRGQYLYCKAVVEKVEKAE